MEVHDTEVKIMRNYLKNNLSDDWDDFDIVLIEK